MKRRHVSAALGGLLFGLGRLPAADAEPGFPNKPLRLIVPWAPGGINDALGRLAVERISVVLKQPIVIDNRSGANGLIGTQAVAQSAADGYTLLLMTSGQHVLSAVIGTKLPYDPLRDFTPFAQIGEFPLILAARSALPANNVRELIALAKAKPGSLNLGSSGQGGIGHLTGENFMYETGTSMTVVSYRGEAPQIVALMAGDIDVGICVNAIAQIKSGALKALGTTGHQRLVELPDVPTLAEQGLSNFYAAGWCGLGVSSKTPAAIVATLAGAARTALGSEETRATLRSRGVEPSQRSPAEISALMKSDFTKYQTLVTSRNLKFDN